MAYTKTVWEDLPSEDTPVVSTALNNIENGIEAVDTVLNSGWIDANETWTYASVDDPTGVITISGDVTTKYSLGMRIKFTNGGNTIYGIITKLAYSSPNTTMTFLHEIDPTDSLALHLMANSAITANYYSTMKVPYGFPLDLSKWSLSFTSTNGSTLTAGSGYTSSPYYLTLPIGLWNARYSISLYGTGSGGLSTQIHAGLGISSLIQETRDMKSSINGYTPNQHCVGALKGATQINITTQSDLHIYVGYGNSNGNATLNAYAEGEPTRIDATIAYL